MRTYDQPVPRARIRNTADYRDVLVSKTSRFLSEPLVTLELYGVASEPFYFRQDGSNPPYNRRLPGSEAVVRVRRSVAKKLARVNRRLISQDVELLVLDGYRSISCQMAVWEHFVGDAMSVAPGISPRTAENRARRYASDPRRFSASDPRTWTLHVTGGAVDVVLRRRSRPGEWLYMGGMFDDPSPTSHTAFYEVRSRSEGLSYREARRNRRLLYWTMAAEGFINLPTEWWHFDWGTQLWALGEGSRRRVPVRAVYSPV